MITIIVIVILLVILIYLVYTRKKKKVSFDLDKNKIKEIPNRCDLEEKKQPIKIIIPDLGLPADMDIGSPEYNLHLDQLGNYLYHQYRDKQAVKAALIEVKNTLQNPQLILAHLQNNVHKYKEENLEESLDV